MDRARHAAKTEMDRNRLTLVMALADGAQEHWAEMLPLTQELMKSQPTSVRAFTLAMMAYAGLKRFDDFGKLVEARIHEHPDELAYPRSEAELDIYRGDFRRRGRSSRPSSTRDRPAQRLERIRVERPVPPRPISQDDLDAAQRLPAT